MIKLNSIEFEINLKGKQKFSWRNLYIFKKICINGGNMNLVRAIQRERVQESSIF